MIKVIENFLDDEYFNEIETFITSPDFSWYFQDQSVHDEDNDYFMFSHTLYTKQTGINSEYFQLFLTLLNGICLRSSATGKNHTKLLRVKANLYTQTNNIINYARHEDYPDLDEYTTAVFNFHNSDGFTRFFVNDTIKDVPRIKNTLLLFDGKIEHFGTTQTNSKKAVVMNFDLN